MVGRRVGISEHVAGDLDNAIGNSERLALLEGGIAGIIGIDQVEIRILLRSLRIAASEIEQPKDGQEKGK